LAVIQQASQNPAPKLRSLVPTLDKIWKQSAQNVWNAIRLRAIALPALWPKTFERSA
jgi:hypothetical protein